MVILIIAFYSIQIQQNNLSYQPEYHVYNTCIGVGEWLCFILFPDF